MPTLHAVPCSPPRRRRSTPAAYRRREPESTALYHVLAEHLESFLAQRAAHPDRAPLPRFVERELRAFGRCGILTHGFVRVHCPGCNESSLVAFSCKGRGFCPSCGGRRMAEAAAHLVDHVLPHVPIRQWVATFPYPIRLLLAYDPQLLRGVRRLFVRTIFSHLKRRLAELGIEHCKPGAVVAVQRFGSALNLNVHLHALFLDGAYVTDEDGKPLRWQTLPDLSDTEVEQILLDLEKRIHRWLVKKGALPADSDSTEASLPFDEDPELSECLAHSILGQAAKGTKGERCALTLKDPQLARAPHRSDTLCAAVRGYSLHAAVYIPAPERRRLERVARYILRPPFVHDRLSLSEDGKVLLQLPHAFADGTTAVLFDPHTFLERLVAQIPRPRANLLTYHGILAPAASWRDHVVPAPPPKRTTPPACEHGEDTAPLESPPTRSRHERYTWAELMRRVFEIEVLTCEKCGAKRTLLAVVTDPDEVHRFLTHLGLPTRAPPIKPAPSLFDEPI